MISSDPNIPVANAARLLLQRVAHIASAFLFAVIVPRMMGPETYGRYTLILSLALLSTLIASVGIGTIIARYVPDLADDRAKLRAFFGRLLTIRMSGLVLSSTVYLGVTLWWLRDLDSVALVLMACGLFLRGVGHLHFTLFIGLNRAARWGMGPVLRSWITLVLLVPGFLLGGLRGACLGLVVAEAAVLAVGVVLARPYLGWPRPRADLGKLSPYMRFGLVYFGSEVLYAIYQRSGEPILRVLTGDYAEIGFFGLTLTVFYVISLAVPEMVSAFLPLFTKLRRDGELDELARWAGRLSKMIAVGGAFAFAGVALLGDTLVPLVLGEAYTPVARNLVPVFAVLMVMALTNVARVLAFVYERTDFAVQSAIARLLVFWTAALTLTPWGESYGMCLAILISGVSNAAVFTWRVRTVFRYPLGDWAKACALAALFAPLYLLRAGPLMNAGLFVGFALGYTLLLLLLRVVTREELVMVWRGARGRIDGGEVTTGQPR